MKHSNLKKLPAYFIVPVIFTLLGYGVLRVALTPVWNLAISSASLIVADDAPNFNPELSSIYDSEADKQTSEDENVIPVENIAFPNTGEQYGKLTCKRIGLNAPVYWGDTSKILRSGAGQSEASLPPGFNSAIIICAHNTSFFKPLKNVKVGDVITFDTNYDTYQYNVTSVEVLNENVLANKMDGMYLQSEETLLLYTCYPFHAISGRKTDRLVVLGERVEGKDVKWMEE